MTEPNQATRGSGLQTLATALSLLAAAGALFVSVKAYDSFDPRPPASATPSVVGPAPAPTRLQTSLQDSGTNIELTRILDQLGEQISLEQKRCKADDLQDCRQHNFPIGKFLESRIIAATRNFKTQQTVTLNEEHPRENAPVLSNPARSQLLTVLVLAKFDLGRILPYANFAYADVSGLRSEDVSFEKGQLEHVNFSRTRFDGINLEEAKLAYSNFAYATLNNARLRFADLSNADLTCTDLSTADFEPADIQGANNWQKAIFSEQQRQQLGLNHVNECPPPL
ncbi:MAG TPA: pentapeptide repeat-containing protein [Pseudomonadales bacterium]|nr:pentapeptide repeat-containing protein [Pseudomonadales bacterium]